MIFTSEGKLVSQSLRGKVVIVVSKRAKSHCVPFTFIAGGVDYNIEKGYNYGITSIFAINKLTEDLFISRHRSEENLRFAVDNIMRFMKSIK